ncbi:MAG: hypothetical protein ACJAVT_002083 [Yoonia sp.]|jgi:hypothetical protein
MPKVPKHLSHIWIGPKPAPTTWMQSWRNHHPDWTYEVYDNNFLTSYPFRTQRLINEYFWRGEFAGVQDLMRYEILHAFGGFIADADSVCQHPIDELLVDGGLFTVYDRVSEVGRGVCPFLASNPGNPFLGEVIDRLVQLEPWQLRKPFISTGNLFLMSEIKQRNCTDVTIFPSHYFVPWHHSTPSDVYDGPDKIYAEQMWGSATFRYNRGDAEGEISLTRTELKQRAAGIRAQLREKVQPGLSALVEISDESHAAVSQANVLRTAYDERVSTAGWAADLMQLNTALKTSLSEAGFPFKINGNGFYRHQQDQPLTEGRLMTRTKPLRQRVASYLAGASSVLQVGVDAGHMLLLQRTVAPEVEVVAVDSATQLTKNSAPVEVYTPAAVSWLQERFPDGLTFLIGRPAQVINKHRQRAPDWTVDLLHFNGLDTNFLKSYGAAQHALVQGGLILIHGRAPEAVWSRVEELQLLGEVGVPIEFIDYGKYEGALAVLQKTDDCRCDVASTAQKRDTIT